ncbi:Nramp family divalent metal transporter [Lacinutrix sp. C3R15]|uniref:Nramp family divalent metal transporter n=1 Tax=Flavobacteriaceae TaxID=49546 RepID=UPI001C087508|nr:MULTISPECIES: Nramp family divalent metal transporter [Flavobacteriaceae]MBU2939318.1 Nramp family divalent metal transporter [Lacinutrix sp. C3R15]MDO6622633.1 Nramp family divalent metal transporter [Oceanihabitans sp. 1_MG-2023]
MSKFLKKLGPGLLFAGAAIGVSHLVQSTRAGADFGLGLLWALLVVNLFKYPFFQFGPRYASATGESLLNGYKKLGKGVLVFYFILNIATMFTIQAAVTIVTAGLATTLFGDFIDIKTWTIIILCICLVILFIGKYKLLDRVMKIIIITLTLSTLIAVAFAFYKQDASVSFTQILPKNSIEIAFLIAFMGWMPAPLDVAVWQSLWTIEKQKEEKEYTPKSALLDYNIGYVVAIFLGISFLLLGYLVMHNSGNTFSTSAAAFSNQLILMYTKSLGSWAYILIGIAAFTTMFSTTLTTLDASPRAMNKTMELLTDKTFNKGYLAWIIFLVIGSILIFFYFNSEMGLLIKIATILSFLTAPFYAIINYTLISGKHTPKEWHPSKALHVLSILGIIFLIAFSIWYITIL